MVKYDPLSRYLKRQKTAELHLSFTEIERMLGAMLPKSANHPRWWTTAGDPGETRPQHAAWMAAGYDAFLIAGTDRVNFRKTGASTKV